MKKTLVLCALLTMILAGMMAGKAQAAEIVDSGACGMYGYIDNVTWTLDDEGLLTISGTGNMEGHVNCPDALKAVIEGSVTSIGESAFSGCYNLTEVEIGEGVKSIGSAAFYNCKKISSVTIPKSVVSISSAFDWSNSSEHKVYISDMAAWCSLSSARFMLWHGGELYLDGELVENLVIPEGVTVINDEAFSWYSSLKSVSIPGSVQSIGEYAFKSCPNLNSVTILDGVRSIGDCAFDGCSGLTSVTIPDSVTSIGKHAFWKCSSLTSVTIPDSVTSIEAGTFSGCNNLKDITLPESLTSIGDNTFAGCESLDKVEFPSGMVSIGEYAFSNCNALKSVSIPLGLKEVGRDAFWTSGLRDVYYEGSRFDWPVRIEVWGGSRAHFSVPVVTQQCAGGATYTVDFEKGEMTVFGEGTLRFAEPTDRWTEDTRSVIHSVYIQDGVTEIGGSGLKDFTALESVSIPKSVTYIGSNAFSGCDGLENVSFEGSLGDWANIISSSVNIPLPYDEVHFADPLFTGECGVDTTFALNAETGELRISGQGSVTSGPWSVLADVVKVVNVEPGVTYFLADTIGNLDESTVLYLPATLTSVYEDYSKGPNYAGDVFYAGTYENFNKIGGNIAFKNTNRKCGTGVISHIFERGLLDPADYVQVEVEISHGTCLVPSHIRKGSVQPVEIDPELGYVISGMKVDGNQVSDYSFTAPDAETVHIEILIEQKYDIVDQGTCDGLTWFVTRDNKLVFTGTGAIPDYESHLYYRGEIPWSKYGSSVRELVFEGNVTAVGAYAFMGFTELKELTIPGTVQSIGGCAFKGCTGLKKVIISEGVSSLPTDKAVFEGCGNLLWSNGGYIVLPSTLTTNGYLLNFRSSDVFYVGGGTTDRVVKETDQGMTTWHPISSIDDIATIIIHSPEGLELVPSKYMGVVGDEIVVGTVCKRGHKLDSVTVNNERLSGNSFQIQKGGTITLAAQAAQTSDTPVTGSVGESAEYWYADNECHINGSDMTWDYASSLQSSASTLRPSPLAGKGDFQRVYIEPGITSIGAGLLYSAYGVREIYIASGVTEIGAYAFKDLINLEQIEIPATVTSIGNRTFSNCSSLHDVYFGGTEEEWNALTLGSDNGALYSAKIHFRSSASKLPDSDLVTGILNASKEYSDSGILECHVDIVCSPKQPSAVFIGARYSEDGQFLGIFRLDLSQGQRSQPAFPFEEASYVKLYMIDPRTTVPLCKAVILEAK